MDSNGGQRDRTCRVPSILVTTVPVFFWLVLKFYLVLIG